MEKGLANARYTEESNGNVRIEIKITKITHWMFSAEWKGQKKRTNELEDK